MTLLQNNIPVGYVEAKDIGKNLNSKDYKEDLNERNIQPLSDDYLKFIRFGQNILSKKR